MNKYIFAVVRDYGFDANLVYVTNRDEFVEDGVMSDHTIDEVLELLGDDFVEESDNVFAANDPDLTKTGIIELLKKRGLEHDEDFQDFIEKSNTEF